MPLRGPGAGRQKAARELVERTKQRKPSWAYSGLSRYERVVRFIQSLPVTKGPLAGKRIKLLPGQLAWLKDIYDRPDDHSADMGILSQSRGNGKTGLIQGLTLCHLVGPEAQSRGEVYAAAVDRQQSGKMFNEIEATLLACPELLARVNIQRFAKKIEVLGDPDLAIPNASGLVPWQHAGNGSIFEAMSGDARKGHGLAPSFWCYDELARVSDGDLLEALRTGSGKRMCLGVVISTQAPDDEHPLSKLIDDAPNRRSTVCHVIAAATDADWTDPDVLRSVNPAIGHFLNERPLLEEQTEAQRIPAFEAGFRNLRLNQRIDARQDERLVTAAVWKQNDAKPDMDKIKKRVAFGGLDLASTNDLCAFVLVVPDEARPCNYDVVVKCWTPAGQMKKRTPAEQQRFREWRSAGCLTEVAGDVITTATVAADIVDLCADFDVRLINYDRYHIKYLLADLAEIGVTLPMESFGQGHSAAMAPAVRFLVELALTGRLRHGANPVLTAAVANAIVVPDRAGNPMVDKPRSNSRGPVRIDPAIALLMALGAAKGYEPPPPKPSLAGFFAKPVMII